MSFLYPYTVTIKRTGYSSVPGEGLAQSETTVISGASANIELKRDKGFGSPAGFPAPTNTSAPMPEWIISVKMDAAVSALGKNAFQNGDQAIDDVTGRLFKVDAAFYTPLAWQLACTPYKPDA